MKAIICTVIRPLPRSHPRALLMTRPCTARFPQAPHFLQARAGQRLGTSALATPGRQVCAGNTRCPGTCCADGSARQRPW